MGVVSVTGQHWTITFPLLCGYSFCRIRFCTAVLSLSVLMLCEREEGSIDSQRAGSAALHLQLGREATARGQNLLFWAS